MPLSLLSKYNIFSIHRKWLTLVNSFDLVSVDSVDDVECSVRANCKQIVGSDRLGLTVLDTMNSCGRIATGFKLIESSQRTFVTLNLCFRRRARSTQGPTKMCDCLWLKVKSGHQLICFYQLLWISAKKRVFYKHTNKISVRAVFLGHT